MSSPSCNMMGTCKHSIMQTENLAIMGELAALFDRETPKSRSSGEASYPALNTGGPLEEPRRASGLGKCQLNELLIYTPYFHLYPEYHMDRRIGRSSGHQHITTSAPAQDRPPPLPPLAPPTRRGRSSDEHAGTATASASDRNRTGSPIARHRPSEMHIMQNKWIGHTAELRCRFVHGCSGKGPGNAATETCEPRAHGVHQPSGLGCDQGLPRLQIRSSGNDSFITSCERRCKCRL